MALFFHSDDVDQLIPIKEAVRDHGRCAARYDNTVWCLRAA